MPSRAAPLSNVDPASGARPPDAPAGASSSSSSSSATAAVAAAVPTGRGHAPPPPPPPPLPPLPQQPQQQWQQRQGGAPAIFLHHCDTHDATTGEPLAKRRCIPILATSENIQRLLRVASETPGWKPCDSNTLFLKFPNNKILADKLLQTIMEHTHTPRQG